MPLKSIYLQRVTSSSLVELLVSFDEDSAQAARRENGSGVARNLKAHLAIFDFRETDDLDVIAAHVRTYRAANALTPVFIIGQRDAMHEVLKVTGLRIKDYIYLPVTMNELADAIVRGIGKQGKRISSSKMAKSELIQLLTDYIQSSERFLEMLEPPHPVESAGLGIAEPRLSLAAVRPPVPVVNLDAADSAHTVADKLHGQTGQAERLTQQEKTAAEAMAALVASRAELTRRESILIEREAALATRTEGVESREVELAKDQAALALAQAGQAAEAQRLAAQLEDQRKRELVLSAAEKKAMERPRVSDRESELAARADEQLAEQKRIFDQDAVLLAREQALEKRETVVHEREEACKVRDARLTAQETEFRPRASEPLSLDEQARTLAEASAAAAQREEQLSLIEIKLARGKAQLAAREKNLARSEEEIEQIKARITAYESELARRSEVLEERHQNVMRAHASHVQAQANLKEVPG